MLNLSNNRINHDVNQHELGTLNVLNTPKAGKWLAKWLLGIFLVLLVVMFVPWQQNIRGTGSVTTLRPENRPQTIETTIAGRIEKWNVREGEFVEKGDTIMVISEIKDKFFDPNLIFRLADQIDAKESSINAKSEKIVALDSQIEAIRMNMEYKLIQARNKIRQATLYIQSDSIDFEAEKINYQVALDQYNRFKQLYDSGNISLNKFQEYQLKLQQSQSKYVAKENKYMNSQNDLAIAQMDLNTIKADATEKMSKARSDMEATRSELFESRGSLAKLQNEYANIEIRNRQYHILAPQNGFVVKAIKAGLGQTIKEGEAVVTVMPDQPDIAVEMYVKAMDVPLLSRGRKVRLEFDGWPALQFSGWPSVAVGTFGGKIEVIDYVNSTDGKYRILVTPDEEEEPWPEQLRMGSGVYGWAMLDEVPVWYELWRQLNGFPPSLENAPDNGEGIKENVAVKK